MGRVCGTVSALLLFLFLLGPGARAQTLEQGQPPCSEQAVAAARAGADANDPAATYRLARYYSTGKCIAGDGPKAIELYARAAELGYAPAFYNLGIISAGGRQDYKAAEAAFLKGAELGHRGCQLQLGVLYAFPIPGVSDDVKAFAWLSLVVARNDLDTAMAHDLLKRVQARLSPPDRARAEAYRADVEARYEHLPAPPS